MLFGNYDCIRTEASGHDFHPHLMVQHNPVVNAKLRKELVKKFMNFSTSSCCCFYMVTQIHQILVLVTTILYQCRYGYLLSQATRFSRALYSLILAKDSS